MGFAREEHFSCSHTYSEATQQYKLKVPGGPTGRLPTESDGDGSVDQRNLELTQHEKESQCLFVILWSKHLSENRFTCFCITNNVNLKVG